MTLNTAWIAEDEAWRPLIQDLFGENRKYADLVRKAVVEHKTGAAAARGDTSGPGGLGGAYGNGAPGYSGGVAGGGEWMWLYCVRESKGFLLQL